MAKVCPSCELTYSDDDFFCAADGSPLRSTTAEADNLVGTVIADRYRVEAILGEGGMGRVYRARHVRVPREAAIKVLRRALISDPYAVAAFNREARNAASVGDHPNVAAVYDFGETADGLVFLAMEFIEGETLGRRLEREPVLPPARAVEIVRQIAAGLSAAHELPEPVVHRDLKPDNILLKTTRDGSDWVKIVDFGIAKAAKRDTQMLTTPGLVVGTPRYMSPEQLTGGSVDARSDIYALGIIAFQMLTGRMPFPSASRDDESSVTWALQRLTVPPMSLAAVRPDFDWPAAAEDALATALARSESDRTPTAAEFARSLARAFGFTTPSSVVGAIGAVPGPISAAIAAAARSAAPTALVGTPTVAPAPSPAVSGTAPAKTNVREQDAAPSPTPAPAVGTTAAGPTRPVIAAALLVVALGGGFLWQRMRGRDAEPSRSGARQVAVVTDSIKAPHPPVAPPASGDTTTSAPAATDATPAPRTPERTTRPSTPGGSVVSDVAPARRVRDALDRMHTTLADPDAAAASGTSEKIVRDVARLLPTLTSRGDSVEATIYAIEANLFLDRPAEACRLLNRIRGPARGSAYESRVDVFLTDSALACASRR
ncbi:MAG TPA: serine/threonine-protein kinase [Gemmatimonadaceae bacterium]|nr:serine/threonine-protein kinase [Gemmatimonadaceae bacterium]